MTDPLTATSIATLIFTTAVGKLTEALTEDARQQLAQKLYTLKQVIGAKFHGRAKAALARANNGDAIDRETVTQHLGRAMEQDSEFAQQVRFLAKEIQQMKSNVQRQDQNGQNMSGSGDANQVSHSTGPMITGGRNNTIILNP